MAISVFCTTCDRAFRVRDDLAGKRVKCSGCGQVLAIPSGDGATKAPAQDPAEEGNEPAAARSGTGSPSRPLQEKPPSAPPDEERPAPRNAPKKKRRPPAPSFLSRNIGWFVGGAAGLLAVVIGLVVSGLVIGGVFSGRGRPPQATGPQIAQAKSEDQAGPAHPATTAKNPDPNATKPPPAQPNSPASPPPPLPMPGVTPSKGPDKRPAEDVHIQLVLYGPARFEHPQFRGKNLTGVVIEIEGLHEGVLGKFEAGSVAAQSAAGPDVPAAVLFTAGGRDGLAPLAKILPASFAVAGDILIGKEKYAVWPVGKFGEGVKEARTPNAASGRVQVPADAANFEASDLLLAMPLILEQGGGVEYGFVPGKKARLGFLFATEGKELSRLQVLGRSVELDPQKRAADVAAVQALPPNQPPSNFGEIVQELKGHTKNVTVLAFLPGGKRALSGSEDRTLRLWDLESGQALRVIEGGQNNFVSLAVAADGRRAFTGANTLDGGLLLWDLETGKQIQRLEPKEKNHFGALALSAGGKRLLAGGLSTTLLFDVPAGKELRAFKPATGFAALLGGGLLQTDVALSPDDRHALVSDSMAIARVYDTSSGQVVRQFGSPEHTDMWTSAVFSSDARFLLTGSGGKLTFNNQPVPIDFGVRLWDVRTGKVLQHCKGHDGDVRSLALSADGKRGLSAGADKKVILWNTEKGQELGRLSGEEADVGRLALSADGSRALIGGRDGTVRLWKLAGQ
jgi:WD40 repeat protein